MDFDPKKLPPPPRREPERKKRLVLRGSLKSLGNSDTESACDSLSFEELKAWERSLEKKAAELQELESKLAQREDRILRHETRLQRYTEQINAA
jgi:hypothetical protein